MISLQRKRPWKYYVSLLIMGIFILTLSRITNARYWSLPDQSVTDPATIIAGQSLAPNQYRLLTPLLYSMVTKITNNPKQADRLVTFCSIMFCYTACAVIFWKCTNSFGCAMLCLLGLLGSFETGFGHQYRQEFWDTGLVTLSFLLVNRGKPRWIVLVFVSALGSLNRETWAFAISAFTFERKRFYDSWHSFLKSRDEVFAIAMNSMIYVSVFILVRWYYGSREMHCGLWRFRENIWHLLWPFSITHSLWALGSGLMLIYILSMILGNRRHIHFIAGYMAPLLGVSFWIANWQEHRIFYPIYPILLASLVEYFSTDDGRGASSEVLPSIRGDGRSHGLPESPSTSY